MAQQERDFQNILVIHFGQLGDVVLGLPALAALRRRFPAAKITVISGRSTAQIVRLAGTADEQIVVDRVEMRDGSRLHSIARVFGLVKDVRRRRFDLVVDLHSLYETNILGFLSGAHSRVFANRGNRSLDRLARFPEKPPKEEESTHYTDRYLNVVRTVGVMDVRRELELTPAADDLAAIRKQFTQLGLDGKRLVGMFLGAGHPSRRWPIEKYAELAARLVADQGLRVLVFLGPEEMDLVETVRHTFSPLVVILDTLKLLPLFAALSLLDVLVSNDTGPTHLAAATDASIVMISHIAAPSVFLPLSDRLSVINSRETNDITVDEVYQVVLDKLGKLGADR